MDFKEHLKELEAKLKNPIKGIPIKLPNFNKYKRYLNHEDRILVTAATGSHKLQPYDSVVYTPEGKDFMGNISKNSFVITKSGKPTKVLQVFPKKDLNIYKVSFSDKTSVECCDDHLWEVTSRHRKFKSIKSVRELIDKGYINLNSKSRSKYTVDICNEVEHTKKELPLDPYLLGYLLGNGSMHGSHIIIHSHVLDHEEIVSNLILPKNITIKRYTPTSKNGARSRISSGIIKELNNLGLINKHSNNKFIPKNYLYSNIEDRYKLLAGLLDSDGSIIDCKTKHKISYSSVSEQLIDDVRELILSLGGMCTKIRNKEKTICKNNNGNYSFHLSLRTRKNPFLLKRKKDIFDKYQYKYRFVKAITNIEYVGKKDGQCILVDDPSHLYLTDFYTVTHNTQVVTKLFIVDIVDYIKANPTLDIKIKIYYFSIELSKYVFYCRLYNYLLGRKGIVIDLEELMSPTLQSTVDAIAGLQSELDLINKHLEVIDDIDNVDQMFKYLSTDLQKYGKITTLADGNYTYTKFDPNQFSVVITDTVNALPSTKGESDNYNAVKKWSEIYTKIHLSKRFRCVTINVQQLDNSVQARQYSGSGLKIDEKHEPNLGALSTVKTTPMDHTCVISLYKPANFKITNYDGYDLRQLGDNHLKINIMKNTFGQSGPNVSTHLYIDGATGNFEELPLSVNKAALDNFMTSKGLNKMIVNKTSETYLL